jgi:MFS family permease
LKTLQSPLDVTVLARAAAKVKRHVLPLFVVMFIVNYIDRVNIGFVRSHMETDLGIGAAAYGLGAGLFFVGYALFEVPSNMLLQRYGARAWLTRIMFTWGAAAMAMAFVVERPVSMCCALFSARPRRGSSPASFITSPNGCRRPSAARPWRCSSAVRPLPR